MAVITYLKTFGRPSVLLACALWLFGGCRSRQVEDLSDVKVIGGARSSAGQYPGVISLGRGPMCTATVVGRRLILTAAHCVLQTRRDGSFAPPFVPGGAFEYTDGLDLSGSQFYTATVDHIEVHPEYLRSCRENCLNLSTRAPFPPDVAVIAVKDEITHVPAASMDYQTLAAAETSGPAPTPMMVHIVGYGCDGGHNRREFPLAQQWARVPLASLRDIAGIRRLAPDPRGLMQSYTLTRGRLLDPQSASLCPGDSGGPIFLVDSYGRQRLVGVNSSAWFPSDLAAAAAVASEPERLAEGVAAGVPSVSLHTRIDDQSRYAVGTWLRAVVTSAAD